MIETKKGFNLNSYLLRWDLSCYVAPQESFSSCWVMSVQLMDGCPCPLEVSWGNQPSLLFKSLPPSRSFPKWLPVFTPGWMSHSRTQRECHNLLVCPGDFGSAWSSPQVSLWQRCVKKERLLMSQEALHIPASLLKQQQEQLWGCMI